MIAAEDRNEEGGGCLTYGFVLTSTTNNSWAATISPPVPSCSSTAVINSLIEFTLKDYANVIKIPPSPFNPFTVPLLGHFHFIALGGDNLLNIQEWMQCFNSLQLRDKKADMDAPSNAFIWHGRCNTWCNLTVHLSSSFRIFVIFPVASRRAVLLATVCLSSCCTLNLRCYSWYIYIDCM